MVQIFLCITGRLKKFFVSCKKGFIFMGICSIMISLGIFSRLKFQECEKNAIGKC